MPNEFHSDIPAKVIADMQAHFAATPPRAARFAAAYPGWLISQATAAPSS
ncbi:hypothetical protein KB206_01700 [Microvirga sp. STS02]|nr:MULTISPECIES: hypothetical protein [Bacteria]MBH8567581.1 hypothetical protein [Hymenobacter negativus]MBR7207313.1 hypothetical protein [Microvirga sp. STS02]